MGHTDPLLHERWQSGNHRSPGPLFLRGHLQGGKGVEGSAAPSLQLGLNADNHTHPLLPPLSFQNSLHPRQVLNPYLVV